MKKYRITFEYRVEAYMLAKSPSNALVNWLKLYSAANILPRGCYKEAKEYSCTKGHASSYVKTDSFGRKQYAEAFEC